MGFFSRTGEAVPTTPGDRPPASPGRPPGLRAMGACECHALTVSQETEPSRLALYAVSRHVGRKLALLL